MNRGKQGDPFAKIDEISVSKTDYWVDQLNDPEFDADAVAQVFFASKAESEVSTTLGKITTLKDNIEKILRSKVTSNYMTFIKARDTIKKTGLEMSELRELVDNTSRLIQDVRNNRLETSKTMRKSSIIGMVTTLANTPKLGYDGVERILDDQGLRGRADSYSSSDSSSYSDVESNDDDIPDVQHKSRKGDKSLRKDKSDHDKAVSDLLKQYTNKAADPNSIPDWFTRAPVDLTNLIIEKSYSAAVKLVCRVRDYASAWGVQYMQEKDAYKEAKRQGLDEQALGLQGLSRDERKAAVSKQNKVTDIVASIEAKQLHFARTLKDSIIALPHSPIWGIDEQRKRLKMLITLGHFALAAEAFSKSRMDIIETVLRDVEASGDPKIYIADISKGFYVSMLDVSLTFLQLFAHHAQVPSIMNILVTWCHQQTAALVDILMQQIREASKEYVTLSILHLKPNVDGVGNCDSENVGGSIVLPNSPRSQVASPVGRERSESNMSTISAITSISTKLINTIRFTSNFRFVEGPLKFTRECLNIAFQQAVELNRTGLQGFADLSWLLLPQLKKLVNSYSEDLIKETINQVRVDTWVGTKARVVTIEIPSSLLNQSVKDEPTAATISVPISDTSDEDRLLGSSFDWIAVSITHYLHDAWHLLRVPTNVTNSYQIGSAVEKKSSTGGVDGDSSDDDVTHATDNNSEDDSNDDEEEIDPISGEPRYRKPAYRRMNLCEIEPIIVTNVLRLVSHYVIELGNIDITSKSFEEDSSRFEVLLNTCHCLREKTIPSIHKFIEKVFFNLNMCRIAHGSSVPSPHVILDQCVKKLNEIEAKLMLNEN